jgi:membrane protease YdiL (CAAX protease family)
MNSIKAFIKRHLLLSYFTLVFALSWGAMLLVVGPGGFLGTKEIPEVLEPFLYVAMLLGPSVAGIVLTGLLYGRAGFRDLLTRMTRWRVGARWYAVALLTAPLYMMAVLFALSLTSPVFLPSIIITADKASVLLMGIFAGLVAGIFEELGWTGFAIPALLRLRHGILSTGLIVGVLWGAWHFPLFSGSGSSSGVLPPALYLLVLLFSVLPAFRVLMVWVYDRTNGSLLVAMLMHTSLTASTLILMPLATGVAAVTYDLVLAAALWVFVGAVALANGGHLSRQPPLRKRVA